MKIKIVSVVPVGRLKALCCYSPTYSMLKNYRKQNQGYLDWLFCKYTPKYSRVQGMELSVAVIQQAHDKTLCNMRK